MKRYPREDSKTAIYTLDPSKNFYENLAKVFEMKILEENKKFEYINPHMMSEILNVMDSYGTSAGYEVGDHISKWVADMFGA